MEKKAFNINSIEKSSPPPSPHPSPAKLPSRLNVVVPDGWPSHKVNAFMHFLELFSSFSNNLGVNLEKEKEKDENQEICKRNR